MKVIVKKLQGKECVVDVSSPSSPMRIPSPPLRFPTGTSRNGFISLTHRGASRTFFRPRLPTLEFLLIPLNKWPFCRQMMPSETVLQLKHKVSDLLGIDVPQQKLLLTGKTLAGKEPGRRKAQPEFPIASIVI